MNLIRYKGPTGLPKSRMAEALARSFGVPIIILRPFNTFGPRQSERAIIGTIMRQEFFTLPR
jgi:nucleoside-diphosphate-sugar epimerase